MFGSAGHTERHRAELKNHVAAVIYDVGSGRTPGYGVNGRPELRSALAKALSIVPGMGEKAHPIEAAGGSDHLDFMLSGVPTFFADQAPAAYLHDYHAESDVFERVDVKEAKRNAGLTAVLTWALAAAPNAPGKQQTRAQVDALLKANKMDEELKSFNQWADWVAGTRGFPAP